MSNIVNEHVVAYYDHLAKQAWDCGDIELYAAYSNEWNNEAHCNPIVVLTQEEIEEEFGRWVEEHYGC